MSKVQAKAEETFVPTWIPDEKAYEALEEVSKDFTKGRSVINKSYNQFNGRQLYDCIDDWTMRWNGFLTSNNDGMNPTSNIFLNFTRNAMIAWLAKVASDTPKAKILATNKKSGTAGKKIADIYKDIVESSERAENYHKKFMQLALETASKGTGIMYEGYLRDVQEREIPDGFDMETGEGKFKKEKVVVYDDCYAEIVPIEDFYIANPYQEDVQKQPFIIWKKTTTYEEAKSEFGHYENWKYVKKGAYAQISEPTTFYRNELTANLSADQVEVVRHYKGFKHKVMVNGVIIYDGATPFKDGKYPFAKAIFEPFGNDFFWGMGFPNKVMGEQDQANTFINMMIDKTGGSLQPYGLSSDLDDLIEDDVLAPNKIRKVSDISKWKFDTLPGVSSGEFQMLQQTMNLFKENSGDLLGAGSAVTPRGGKMQTKQVMLKQQEMMQKLGFSMNYLEDYERDHKIIRLAHCLQFYSIPKIEKATGKKGKEIEQLMYRDIKLSNVKLEDGRKGSRIIKLVGKKTDEERQKLADDLSVTEEMGEQTGTPTEALAVVVDTLNDYNYDVEIVKNSSYEKNQILDQAARMEFVQWRLSLAEVAPVNAPELVKWVEESFDLDSDRFAPVEQPNGTPGMAGADQTNHPEAQAMNANAAKETPSPKGMNSARNATAIPA